MVLIPVSHPSDVEMRELQAISDELVLEAAFTGYASSCFHGFQVIAIRYACAPTQRIDLIVKRAGASTQLFEHVDGTVTAPPLVTLNRL